MNKTPNETLSFGLAQVNPTVGDLAGNRDMILAAHDMAGAKGCDLVVFPELVVSGYPPEDLVLKPIFLDGVAQTVDELAKATQSGPAMIVGAPWRVDGLVYNAALFLADGAVAAVVQKNDLPNYGVFDEVRVFAPGPMPEPITFKGTRLGVMVCEDMWGEGPAQALKEQGAEILIVINGSPYELDKGDERLSLARARASETGLGLVYVNQVGGQDELVFDGASFVIDADGGQMARLQSFASDFTVVSCKSDGTKFVPDQMACVEPVEGLSGIYQAMVLGLRDYVNKNSFKGVLIGLSGGIDSALSAVVAVDALGADRVHCVMMPSPYTSQDSLDDAGALAKALDMRLDSIAIDPAMAAFDTMLTDSFSGLGGDTTEENIQARSRGITLMALSNKFGYMVLSTGNKSEMSVGYATLYGDMCGGYSVLKDVYKTAVFALSRWRNENCPEGAMGPKGSVMPQRIITKPPSAELKLDQTDQDSLPPYDVLDDILNDLIEGDMAISEITAKGYDKEMVMRVWRMVNIAEYKRRQAPPGVKITRRAFGRERRYPITNSFTGHK
jgi:NAD+ synthase